MLLKQLLSEMNLLQNSQAPQSVGNLVDVFQNNFIRIQIIETQLKTIFGEDAADYVCDFDESGMYIMLDEFQAKMITDIPDLKFTIKKDDLAMVDRDFDGEMSKKVKFRIKFILPAQEILNQDPLEASPIGDSPPTTEAV